MVDKQYFFQIIDEAPEGADTVVDPPYSAFYVERSDVGNVPIFNFTPAGSSWWYLNERYILGENGRTEAPSEAFERVAKRIVDCAPVGRYLYGKEVDGPETLRLEDLDLEELPRYEVDVIEETVKLLADGHDLPQELEEYLRAVHDC